ncbi:general substrate transporter [Aspergillus karnatakaensis]|uniref:general substrate transporter n=1 Tax=Aspergillus karnatakaensis TaxID=1810916 RepID=UPI003CCDE9F2
MFNLDFARGRVLYRLMSLCCCMAFGMYGYDAGVLGGVQETKPFRDALGVSPGFSQRYTLTATVCSLLTSVMGMPLGRRGCILLGDVLVVIGGSLQASAWSVAQMIAGRVVCGFGIGAEMSIKTKQRGPEVAIQCIFLVGGCALAYWVDFGFTRMDNQISWRFPIGFQCFFAVVSGVGMFLLPDTPRWYYARGRYEEGDRILARLHDCEVSDDAVQDMRRSIISSIEFEEESKTFNVMDLLWDRTSLRVGRRIRIAFLLLSMQQMMGINLSVYYSTIIFGQIGLSPFMSQLLAAVMNTTFALGSLFLPSTIERFGRRGIMIYSAVGLTICMAVFVAMIGTPNPTPATQWTAIAAVFLYNFIFGYGWIGVCWLYGPEIAPLTFRHVGGAAAAFGEWLFCFITVFAGGIGLQNVGWKMWLWCLISCALAVPFVYFLCPETTGKTLEEIDLLFARGDVQRDSLDVGGQFDDGKEALEVEHEERVRV